MRYFWILCAVLLRSGWIDPAAAEAGEAAIERIDVQPAAVRLTGPRATVQLVVTGYAADGAPRDLTPDARYVAPAAVTLQDGLVSAAANGSGEIVVSVGALEHKVPVTVEKFEHPVPVSFRLETLAVLTKQGCNSGSCHGKPNGRGALELSLNAFDPQLDERSLIRGPLLRFTQPIDPDESLLLKKPLLRVPHGGGKRLRTDAVAYQILRGWIAEGCRPEPADAPHCVRVEVFPGSGRVLALSDAAPARQQVRVVAHFSDGSARDVTRIASYSVSSERVAGVDEHGLLTGLERGQTAVVVRYLDDIVSTYFTFVKDVPGFVWNDPPENNAIDALVHRKLKQLQYLPSADCGDSVFIRRLSLDVRGLLPTAAETEAFLADESPDKRAKLIDRFLDSPEYARFWGLRMADLLRINREKLSPERAAAYSRWIYETIDKNVPYDQFVVDLLTAEGSTSQVPAANFFRTTGDTKMVTETVAQLFMGSRVLCAQCHNHPYESWTQDNYYQIGAAFHELDRNVSDEQVKGPDGKLRKREPREAEVVIARTPGRAMSNPRTGVVQKPWPTDVERPGNADRRVAFAAWLTAKGNPYFARVAVNRIWTHLLGRGLVEPIDDFRSSNPPVNVELLDALALDFEKSDFDRKHVLRQILNSRTYQRSSETNPFNESDDELCSHARTRLMTAEQMQDAILRLCEGPQRYQDLQAELAQAEAAILNLKDDVLLEADEAAVAAATKRRDEARALCDAYYMTQQPYPQLTSFLTAFGQPPRETPCACERREEANLDQALQLMNSNLIRDQVGQAAGRFETLANDAFLRELYLAALSREPNEVERTRLTAHLESGSNRRQAIEDVIWAVINTNEFMFQH